jgi:4-amino-4-deoxy-L-arabinose transferase-like glycosyltransferase
MHDRWFKWIVVFIFFFLLGTRGLNEPDEGRYAEIGREMAETGDWLVPKIWYVPHLDKPPMTYWLAGLSMAAFGLNEWAIRLPFALCGLSGAWAIYLLGLSLGGRRVGQWSVLILSCSLLYFAIARFVMTDMILLQFICWTIYFGWRAWRCLDEPDPDTVKPVADPDDEDPDFTPVQLARGKGGRESFLWQLAAWVMVAGGFLTKGPLIFLIPAFAFLPLLIWQRKQKSRLLILLLALIPGLTLFAVLGLPWYLLLFDEIKEAFDYMVKGQVVGHALKAAAKNRGGPIFYFVPILLFGFLPWTVLLGWLWRKSHWGGLTQVQKEGWVMLSGWSVLTFVFFSINSAKLPHYIVPMMPALAVMVALRWPDWSGADKLPNWAWRTVMISPLVAMLAIPFVYRFAFKIGDQNWIWLQAGAAIFGAAVLLVVGKRWHPQFCVQIGLAVALLNLFLLVGLMPRVESEFRSNQSLKELGSQVRKEYRETDQLVVYGRIPQGLPLYTWPIISQHRRPWFINLPQHRMPYHFPGNQERLAPYTLPDLAALGALARTNRVLMVGWQGTYNGVTERLTNTSFTKIAESGHWELIVSDPSDIPVKSE